MKRIRYLEILCLLLLALAVGTLLPFYISKIQEEQLLDQIVLEEASAVHITRTEKMEEKSLLEKFAFLLNENIEYIEYITMSQGKNLDYGSAMTCMYVETDILFSMGLLPSPVDFGKKEGKLYTAANRENPAQSLIVWQFLGYGENGEIYSMTLDDATGKLIGLKRLWLYNWDIRDAYYQDYNDMAYLWGGYLEMSDMEIHSISYEDISGEHVLKSLGNQKDQILEAYGLDEKSFLEVLSKTRPVYDSDSDMQIEEAFRDNNPPMSKEGQDSYLNEAQVYDGYKSIVLDLVYNQGEGKSVECRLEWGAYGFGFFSPKEMEEAEESSEADSNGEAEAAAGISP